MTSIGLDPAGFHVLIAKGVHAPTAAYAPVSKRLIRVDTPGATTADMRRFDFRYRRRRSIPLRRSPADPRAADEVVVEAAENASRMT